MLKIETAAASHHIIPIFGSFNQSQHVSLLGLTFSESFFLLFVTGYLGRRGGLMISALDSGSSGRGSGPGRGHCVVFLSKTLYSHGASLHPGV